MSMNTADVRVGDWVQIIIEGHKYPAHVTTIRYYTAEIGVAYLAAPNDWKYCNGYDDIEPIPLSPEILQANGFYWGYTSSVEDMIGNIGGVAIEPPNKAWCYDEGDGEVTVEFPTESDGGVITLTFDRHIEMVFCDPINVHELQDFLRLCGGGLRDLADNFKVK